MDRNWSRDMVSSTQRAVAAECLRGLRSRTSVGEFGYKIQALAAHVLLGLNHRVTAVNATGHPDVVTMKGGQEFRFEVEAEVIGVKRTMLTSSDFAGLLSPGVVGFFRAGRELSRDLSGCWYRLRVWRAETGQQATLC